MKTIFDDYAEASLWYHPLADRLFIFHKATFLMLPCLEREDGAKLICKDPEDVNETVVDVSLEYVGEL